jgi:hypothetical protein
MWVGVGLAQFPSSNRGTLYGELERLLTHGHS